MVQSSEILEEEVLPWIHRRFQETPAHFHKEQEIHPYLIAETQQRLSTQIAEVEYNYDHLNLDGRGHPTEFKNLDKNQIRRVQGEPKFYDPDEPDNMTDVDFAVLPPSGGIVQAKEEGVGKYIDIQSDVELIGEIKHSKNRGNGIYGKQKGLKDIRGLDRVPVDAQDRYFVFVDWWPTNGEGEETFPSDWRKLQEKAGALQNDIKIIYLGRNGEYKKRVLTGE